MIHDPAAEITPALNATLRTRWKANEDAKRTGPQSLIDTTTAALNLTLDQISDNLGEPRDPKPTIIFKLEYPDA